MKIGILGAPGAGKSKFTRALQRKLGNTSVVDNYARRLQKQTGLALGLWASYSENFMVAGLRQAGELHAFDKLEHTITVGTLMDTMVYAMVKSDVVIHNSTAERQVVFTNAQAAVSALSLWYTETWNYDLCFFLPLPKSDPHVWQDSVNDAYAPVLEQFYVPNVYSLDGDAKERADIASKVIEIFSREQAEASAEAEDATAEQQEI